MERAPNAELPKWATNAGLKSMVKDSDSCFAFERETEEERDGVFVPITVRVLLIQRMHLGTQAGA